MEATLKAWKTSRIQIQKFISSYSDEQLNTIPAGFSNNLIWNLGHLVVAQQSLIYIGSGHEPYISLDMMGRYKPGTRPEGLVSAAEIDEIKRLLTDLVAPTLADVEKGIFTSYKERTTGTGFHLANIQDAFEFNNYHEGLHLGYMMSMRKCL